MTNAWLIISPAARTVSGGQRGRLARGIMAGCLGVLGTLTGVAPALADPGDYNATRDGAEAACKAGDLRGFFDVFVRSREARQYFSADTITYTIEDRGGRVVSSENLTPANYRRFPMHAVDYWYFPTEPARSGGPKEYIDVALTQASPTALQVDWAYVHYDGQDQDGESLGNMIDRQGHVVAEGRHPAPNGRLTFNRKNNCWHLASDLRFSSAQ